MKWVLPVIIGITATIFILRVKPYPDKPSPYDIIVNIVKLLIKRRGKT